ncbi:MAG: MerR family transcriptional regulator [Micrococcales bacterium]|nr:MerR family transcriptional regulator [Micrococcales bacterium]
MSDSDSAYLLGIGDFSRLTMLSVRMLRHYDQRGLLAPAQIDPHNGYRFYAPAQLRDAGRIRALRDAGCGIGQIAQLLELYDNADALRAALSQHASGLAAAAQHIADQQSLLDSICQQLEEPSMSFPVEQRNIPAMRVLSLRRTVANYAAEAELWAEFGQQAIPDGIKPGPFGRTFGATFYDPDFKEADVDMSVWAELTQELAAPEGFSVSALPAQTVATATMYGPYEQAGAVCSAIGAWIAQHGHTLAGPMFNIYLVSPAQDPNPENWVTEINFPIAT